MEGGGKGKLTIKQFGMLSVPICIMIPYGLFALRPGQLKSKLVEMVKCPSFCNQNVHINNII